MVEPVNHDSAFLGIPSESLRTSSGIIDSFAGSGTTGAVAHKMGRRWIMVELGEHCHTHIIPRLKKVIDGKDSAGVTDAVGWKGGGGFRHFKLAPSLLEKDHWGNWVISKDYDAAMLAEAMCKHMGYTYVPSQDPAEYWRHGQSSERDFIYVTTASLTHDQLKAISLDVGPERTLLICCKAFSAKADQFENLTIKKIPLTVLSRCEWGRDDYSLKITSQVAVDNSDDADLEVGDQEPDEAAPKKRGRKPKAKPDDQPMLSLGEGEE
ncbi:MAG: site-specific DNA-methyltransferase [Alphaproteobacteria bacterium]|nr:site-specific DNA-methyltransferase [Alphaproteobacteria bacterium]